MTTSLTVVVVVEAPCARSHRHGARGYRAGLTLAALLAACAGTSEIQEDAGDTPGLGAADDSDKGASAGDDTEAPAEVRTNPSAHNAPNPAPNPAPAMDGPAEIDPRWVPHLQAVREVHQSWGLVDDQARWAPMLCMIPRPGRAHLSAAVARSASDEALAHSGKLFTLYAKDPVAYGFPPSAGGMFASPSTPSPLLDKVPQAIVKTAYVPKPVGEGGDRMGHVSGLVPAKRGDEHFEPGDPIGLFMILQVGDADTPGTDAGFIYGTTLPDGTVTSAGTPKSCVGCHQKAPGGDRGARLYGVEDTLKPKPGDVPSRSTGGTKQLKAPNAAPNPAP